jgi:hypothetical protein
MRQNTRVTFAMRDLDRLKCIQAVVDGDLQPIRAADRLGFTTRLSCFGGHARIRPRSRLVRDGMLQLRQLLRIPAASERFDQQHAGVELPTHEIDVVALVGKRRSLRSHDIDIEFKPPRIARLKITEGLER